jgi:hypothetical protein
MATSKAVRQTNRRSPSFRGSPDRDFGDLGNDVPDSSQSGNIGFILLLVLLIGLLLPLMASMYLDSLTAQKRTERNEARIEKLIKELEKKMGKD